MLKLYSGDISVFLVPFICLFGVFFFFWTGLLYTLVDVDKGGQEPDVAACDRQGKRQKTNSGAEKIISRKMCVGG